MIIQYLGLTSFRIQENSVSILFDLPDEASGLKLPRMQNDIILASTKTVKKIKTDKSFVISTPGEFEVKGIFIYGINANGEENNKIIYLVEIAGVRVAHLGKLNQSKLSQHQLEMLEGVDILLLPVGGGEALSSKQSSEIINQLEPRVIIPMNYQLPGLKVKLDTLDVFKKEIGAKFETVDKLKISQKDLPEEDTRFIVIEVAK